MHRIVFFVSVALLSFQTTCIAGFFDDIGQSLRSNKTSDSKLDMQPQPKA